ncbi:MAG: hypothetical protein RIQ89_832 [Bacteroidota bacterium]|jgi:flagellar motor protein MotB/Tol biopolymer transport system component
MYKSILIIFFFFCINLTYAQRYQEKQYSSANKSAIRALEAAVAYYNSNQDEKALAAVKDALKADSKFVEAYLLEANIYADSKLYDKAVASYESSFKADSSFFPNAYFSAAKYSFYLQRYDATTNFIDQFLKYPTATPELLPKAALLRASSLFAAEAVKHPKPFAPINLGDQINSIHDEYFPAITADGSTFLFTRKLPVADGRSGMSQEDFFISSLVANTWSLALAMKEVNTFGNEGAPSLSADGQYLFFTACKELDGYPGGKKGYGSCDVFISKKSGSAWGVARNLELPINSSSWESQPSFSSDGRTLYFVRKVSDKNKNTNLDILISSIDDSSRWSEPVSVSKNINTAGNESSVFIHPDNQTLYFASDGHPGMGGNDLFLSRKQADGSWSIPINLGYPINSSDDENSLLVHPNGRLAYFASAKAGGFGGLDLYSFELPQEAKPIAITYLKGKVMDANTKLPLGAKFELIDIATGKQVVSSFADASTGAYLVSLPAGKTYALNVSLDGYLFHSESFLLDLNGTELMPFYKEVMLHKISVGEKIVLKNIFFDTDKFDVKGTSEAELNKVLVFMVKNKNLKIELSGHTDNTGDKNYNLSLSQKRADAVLKKLIAMGVDGSRIVAKGYGDTKPVAENKTEEGRSQNRRTELMITEI